MLCAGTKSATVLHEELVPAVYATTPVFGLQSDHEILIFREFLVSSIAAATRRRGQPLAHVEDKGIGLSPIRT